MKTIVWEGDSRDVLRTFPDSVKRDLGTGLMYLQCGEVPLDSKPLKTGIPGTLEIRAKDASGQYRTIYACVIADHIHVLHCFKKTTNKTSARDIELVRTRFRTLKERLRHEKH